MNCFNETPPPTPTKEGRGAYEDEILNNFPKFLSEQGNKKSSTRRSEWSFERGYKSAYSLTTSKHGQGFCGFRSW